jgi:hypothetical protein
MVTKRGIKFILWKVTPLIMKISAITIQYVLRYCIAMASKKRVVVDLNARVDVIEASEEIS